MQKFSAPLALGLLLFIAVGIHAQRGDRGEERLPGDRTPGGRFPGGRFPGGRNPGGRIPGEGRPRFPIEGVDKYDWDVDMGSGNVISQKGIVIQGRDVVTILTFDKTLKDLNMSRSAVLINTTSGVMAMKAGSRRGPCFISAISATQAEIIEDFNAWNASVTFFLTEEDLNGTGTPMTQEEKTSLFMNNRALRRFCRRAPIVQTTAVDPFAEEDPETKTLTFLGYDSTVSVVVPVRPEGEGGPGPRGQGRRGQGPRGQGPRGQGRRGGRRG